MKFKIQILVIFSLFVLSCSTKLDATYDRAHVPPPSSTYKTYPAPVGKKTAATQRPYKIKGDRYTPMANASGFVHTGKASWYGKKFHGRKTSNGETYNMYAMTAAHKTLPMNTWVSVHNLENGKKIVVRINDRGPFVYGRIIDLTYTGASKIGIVGPGTAKVRVTALGQATSYSKKTKKPVAFKKMNYYQGKFTIQVASFSIKTNADKYRYKLSKSYKNAHVVTFTDHRGTFYRVRVGMYTNLKDAERFSEKLNDQGFHGAFVEAQ